MAMGMFVVPDLEPIDEGLDAGDEVAQPDAHGHRQENPEGQKAVEKRQLLHVAGTHQPLAPLACFGLV